MKKQIINPFQKCEKLKMEENLRGSFLRRKKINFSMTRLTFHGQRIYQPVHLWLWKSMQCYIYILKVKWRKKINNWSHNFPTKKKGKWNIIKLYKRRGKSIKFGTTHLSAHFWTHTVRSPGMYQVSVCVINFPRLQKYVLSIEALKNTSWLH